MKLFVFLFGVLIGAIMAYKTTRKDFIEKYIMEGQAVNDKGDDVTLSPPTFEALQKGDNKRKIFWHTKGSQSRGRGVVGVEMEVH